MFWKGILLGTVVDNAAKISWNLFKTVMKPLFDGFMTSTGKDLGPKAVEEFFNLLGTSEHDEVMINSALLTLTYHEQFAFNRKMATFSSLSSDPKEVLKLKEYFRRLLVKETVVETADGIKKIAGMPKDVWNSHLQTLDIEHKALHSKFKPFIDWATDNGESFIDWATVRGEGLMGGFEKTNEEVDKTILGWAQQLKENNDELDKERNKKKINWKLW